MKKISLKQPIVVAAVAAAGVLSVVAPVAADTQDTTISSQIGSVLSVFTTNGTVAVNVTPTASGAQTIASDTVTVSTNGPGYTLTLADKDTNTNLVSGPNSIAAHTGTQGTPTALSANAWGYRVDGVGGFGAGPTSTLSSGAISATTFAGVPVSSSPNTLKNTSTIATNDTTTVWYSVAANLTQTPGTYTDIVTYTGTAK